LRREGTRESFEPTCPFCRNRLARPAEIKISSWQQAQGGRCDACDAWYLLDPTGKNVGEVMMLALELAAQALSKNVAELVPGEDYEEAILSYDWRTHRSSGEPTGHMDRYGRLYLLKVKKRSG